MGRYISSTGKEDSAHWDMRPSGGDRKGRDMPHLTEERDNQLSTHQDK